MAVTDLCTLADVRALMQKKPADVAQDALIATQITRVSLEISRWCEREFAPPVNAAVRTFHIEWGHELLTLAPYDLRTVTTVQVDTDQASPITLSADEYRLWPRPSRDGTYLGLKLRPLSAAFGRVTYREREVKVTGDWGFATIPVDVTDACAMTVVHRMNVNVAAFRSPDDSPEGASPPRRGIPPEALQILAVYKRAVNG